MDTKSSQELHSPLRSLRILDFTSPIAIIWGFFRSTNSESSDFFIAVNWSVLVYMIFIAGIDFDKGCIIRCLLQDFLQFLSLSASWLSCNCLNTLLPWLSCNLSLGSTSGTSWVAARFLDYLVLSIQIWNQAIHFYFFSFALSLVIRLSVIV